MHFTTESLYEKIACFYEIIINKVVATEFTYLYGEYYGYFQIK